MEVTILMDNATKRARESKFDKYRQGIEDRQKVNPDVKVHYKVFAFGVPGAIPAKLESILSEITPKVKTD